jgi:hypothetical protein
VNRLSNVSVHGARFVDLAAGNLIRMERQRDSQATPEDATKSTEEQRELQDQLDHQEGDPDAPAGHQDRHQIADET